MGGGVNFFNIKIWLLQKVEKSHLAKVMKLGGFKSQKNDKFCSKIWGKFKKNTFILNELAFESHVTWLQQMRCPQGKNTTPMSLSIQILHVRSSFNRRFSRSKSGKKKKENT